MNVPLLLKRFFSALIFPQSLNQPSQPSDSVVVKQSARPKSGTANPSSSDPALVREIRSQRKFTLAEAIGREGGSFMKGESAIPRPLRATAEINHLIAKHAPSPHSPISTVLQSWAKEDIRVSRHLDAPLTALAQILESLLKEPTTFQEFCRQVAIAQSKLTGDRPHFQKPDCPPHPDARYSHVLVQQQLTHLLQAIQPKTN